MAEEAPLDNVTLILPPHRSERDVRRASMTARWHWVDSTARTNESLRTVTWNVPDEGAQVLYVENHLFSISYLVLSGVSMENTLLRARRVAGGLPAEEAIALAKQAADSETTMWACGVAATLAPQNFDLDLFEIVRRAFTHPEIKVRWCALIAFGYLGWPEFEPDLEKVMHDDSSEQMRETARAILEKARKCDWKGMTDVRI